MAPFAFSGKLNACRGTPFGRTLFVYRGRVHGSPRHLQPVSPHRVSTGAG